VAIFDIGQMPRPVGTGRWGRDKLRIGIAGALLYYYGPYWVHLFEELRIEVITTQKTDKKTIDRGIGVSVPEICVPIKIYNGHVLRLVDQGVGYVFVPRMV